MAASNVEAHRAGHEAFNRRDFQAMTERYADSIAWTDHAQNRTFRTRQEFRDDFLPGWVRASADIRITGPHYFDAGQTVVHLHRRRHPGRAAGAVPHRQPVRAAAT